MFRPTEQVDHEEPLVEKGDDDDNEPIDGSGHEVIANVHQMEDEQEIEPAGKVL